MDYVLFDKVKAFYCGLVNEVKGVVNRLDGEPQLLNNGLYCNYADATQYYDDFFDKTALFLDSLSLAETQEVFVRKTQNYQMREYQYLPSAVFKLLCADYKKRFPGYPKLFSQMYQDSQMCKEI